MQDAFYLRDEALRAHPYCSFRRLHFDSIAIRCFNYPPGCSMNGLDCLGAKITIRRSIRKTASLA